MAVPNRGAIRTWRGLLVISVPILFAAAAGAPTSQKVTLLTGTDYAEIQRLYSVYNYGDDSGNGQMFGSVFTPDGELVSSRIRKGRDAIAANRGPLKQRPQARHFMTNIIITASPEGA